MRELNKSDQLKFSDGSITEVVILNAAFEELQFGSKYVVDIKATIDGYSYFLPSDGLIKKMKEENVDIGDKIVIEKVAPDEKYKYGYFSVTVVNKAKRIEDSPVGAGFAQKDAKMHKSDENFEKQFNEPENKLDLHELSLRVETLEKEVAELKQSAKKNELPF